MQVIHNESCFVPSCRGDEVLVGEEVVIETSGLHPNWPSEINGIVDEVKAIEPHGREYLISYNEDDLQGGPPLETCLISVNPLCCSPEE